MPSPAIRAPLIETVNPKTLSAALDRIRRSINRHVRLTNDEFERFASMLVRRHLDKKERLLSAGEVCWFEGFVHKGLLRVYCTDSEGADHIVCFASEDAWFTDVQSFASRRHAVLNIDALESSDVLLIPRASKERLYIEVPKFERFFRLTAQGSLVALQERLIGCLRLRAVERYREFKERHPELVGRIPQHQIAAYIGISPEFLSKIRRPPSVRRSRKR